jgi:pyrimidine deaminase RibD-like protein
MKLPIKEHKSKHPASDVKTASLMAFVVRRGKVVTVGYNRRVFPNGEAFSQHAEEAALKKAGSRAKGATLYVLRFKKDGSRGMARPCGRCHDTLNRAGIVRVFFSLDNVDRWGKLIWQNAQWIEV